MSIDITLAGLLQAGEREYLNPVIERPGDIHRLNAYADWLVGKDDPRQQFLRDYLKGLASWDPQQFPPPGKWSSVWLDLIGFRLASRLAERRLAAHAETIFRLARPALRLSEAVAVAPEEDKLPIGNSKYGGLPDLPPDCPWPSGDQCRATYNDDTAGEERLAGFLCQINLEELQGTVAARLLPETGLLSFFGFQDIENDNPDKIGVLAMWFPDCTLLVRRSPPEELTEGNECFSSAEMILEEFLDLPNSGDPWQDEFQPIIDADEEAFEFGTWDNIQNVLGYAVATSGDNPTPNRQSRHLIFINSNAAQWQWPHLHVQIDQEDLARQAFDKIQLVWVDWD